MITKIFVDDKEIVTGSKSRNHSSIIRSNREYLISPEIAKDMNTYLSFDPFPTFNDVYAEFYKGSGQNVEVDTSLTKGPGALGVRSIFNKHGAVVLGEFIQRTTEDIINERDSEWRISNNVPLMDNYKNRRAIRKHSGCTVKELVEASRAGRLGRATYDFSDFMYCKYLGRIPNNHLITLRRFPIPVDDYISTLGISSSTMLDPDIASKNAQSIGCMVTWLGTPGNEMQNILKYNVKMPFKWKDSEWNDVQGNGDSNTGVLNGIAGMFDPTYRQQYMNGQVGSSVNKYLGKLMPVGDPPYSNDFSMVHHDQNKVYGPVDTIKGTYMRSEKGLENEHKMTLVFDYELRSYNGINGRQAMLDLLSNILNVTYSTGTFWGGGYKASGAHQNNIFANLNIFKSQGGFSDYVDAFQKDYSNLTAKFSNYLESTHGGDWMSMLKSAANQLGGMILGGMLNSLGRPAKLYANSLLSPAPIGFWHVMIGNPHHPILSMGNMIITNTTIEHYGPLGLDDFPTGLKVTVELDRGKPRDIRELEKLYMHGNDRIYSSMSQKVFKMYEYAKEYKKDIKPADWGQLFYPEYAINELTREQGSQIGSIVSSYVNQETEVVGQDPSLATKIEITDLKKMSYMLQKYFGHADAYSIYVSACEQERGAYKKKKTEHTVPSAPPQQASESSGTQGGMVQW